MSATISKRQQHSIRNKLYHKRMDKLQPRYFVFGALVVVALALLVIRFCNWFVIPYDDALKVVNRQFDDAQINWDNKCVDLKVRASYKGHDHCNEYAETLNEYRYVKALFIFMKGADLCGPHGCFSVSMNVWTWALMVLPASFAFTSLLGIGLLALLIVCAHNSLKRRDDLPWRNPPYAEAKQISY